MDFVICAFLQLSPNLSLVSVQQGRLEVTPAFLETASCCTYSTTESHSLLRVHLSPLSDPVFVSHFLPPVG